MRVSLLLAAVLLAALPAAAYRKEKEKGHGPDLDATLRVACDETDPPRQITVTSPTLVAENGGARAWVKVESGPDPKGCQNATELWIAAGAREPFRLAYRQRPQDPDLWGNGMRMVDWSPDGQLLLTETREWSIADHHAPADRRILVFQAGSASVFEIDPDQLASDPNQRDCVVRFQLLGFTPQGAVVLRTHLGDDSAQGGQDGPAAKACGGKDRVWAVDARKQSKQLLPDDFQPGQNSVWTKTAKLPK